ncbi:MAG: copper chaperone PCu(A)C [Rhodospirillaceae bacterium]
MRFLHTTIITAAVLIMATPVLASDFKAGAIEVEHPWSRATAEGAPNGAVFVELKNEGKEADRLISATTSVAAKVELHTHIMDGEVMKMRQVDAIAIAPGAKVHLAPGGLHIMLLGIKEPLSKDKNFPLTLTFEKAGAVTVDVSVLGAGETRPNHDHDHKGNKY